MYFSRFRYTLSIILNSEFLIHFPLMLTRILPSPPPSIPITPEEIQSKVDQRGFYLYEWISQDELQMTLERDYLRVVKGASIPLAIITAIAGFIGFSGGIFGALLAIL